VANYIEMVKQLERDYRSFGLPDAEAANLMA
jgi:hypothetical protein